MVASETGHTCNSYLHKGRCDEMTSKLLVDILSSASIGREGAKPICLS